MDITATVRISKDGEYMNTEDFIAEVDDDFDVDNPDYEQIFDYLTDNYPDDFPEEEPGVDMEIIDISL